MAIRYSDMSLEESGARDFVARQRTPTFPQVATICVSAALISISIVLSASNETMLVATILALFAIIGWYVIYHLMRSRDTLLATEFQNAMFASAMGLHNKFCLIIKRDGTIVYLDQSFRILFPDFLQQRHRSIDMLLKQGKVSREDNDRVHHALDKGVYDKVIVDIVDAHGIAHRIILSIEPILRPAGFIMLRGREYVENRGSGDAIPTSSLRLFDKSSISLFSDVMEHLKMGLYMASPIGNLIYCNPLLEAWLGYNEGEVVARNLNIAHLVPSQRAENASSYLADIEGIVQLARKPGGFVRAFVNQKVIHDDTGRVLGCAAVVHLYRQNPPTDKQKASHDRF